MDVKIYDDCDTRFSFSGRVLLAPDESRFQTNGYRTICLIAWGPYLNPDRRFKVSLLSETVIVFRGDNVRWKKNVYFLFFFFERTTSRHGNNGTIVTLTSRSFARCRRITTRRAHVRPTRNKARARAYLSDKKIEKKVKKVKKKHCKTRCEQHAQPAQDDRAAAFNCGKKQNELYSLCTWRHCVLSEKLTGFSVLLLKVYLTL